MSTNIQEVVLNNKFQNVRRRYKRNINNGLLRKLENNNKASRIILING